jgi:hypothetical protein
MIIAVCGIEQLSIANQNARKHVSIGAVQAVGILCYH